MKIVKYHRKHMPVVCNDGYRRQIIVESEFPRVIHYPKTPGRDKEKINLELSGNIQLEMSRSEALSLAHELIQNFALAESFESANKKPTNKPENMEPFIQAYKDVLQAEVGTTHQNFDELSEEKIRHDCVSFLKLSKEYLNCQNLRIVAEILHCFRNGGSWKMDIKNEDLEKIAAIAQTHFKPILVRSRLDVGNTLEVLEA